VSDENMSYMAECLEGIHGPEAEEEAVVLLQEAGEWEAGVESEMDRLAKSVGRDLTEAEKARVLEGLPYGDVPNLVDEHAEDLRSRNEHPESRKELMAEAAQQVIDQQRAEEAPAETEEGVAQW
jgi:hypothetical protein